MKNVTRAIGSIVATLMIMVGVLFVFPSNSQAAPVELSSEEKSHIMSQCAQIKGSLSQLHASDALLRVNRGQAYESMVRRLMDPFNSRINSGGFDNRAMTTYTSQYTAALALFRADYIAYEQKVANTLKINCKDSPTEFYQAILDARELRSVVHDDVNKLHKTLTDYESSVNDFLLNFKRLAN